MDLPTVPGTPRASLSITCRDKGAVEHALCGEFRPEDWPTLCHYSRGSAREGVQFLTQKGQADALCASQRCAGTLPPCSHGSKDKQGVPDSSAFNSSYALIQTL